MTEIKYCTKCGEGKPATREYFYTNRATYDHLTYRCIPCIKETRREEYAANPEVFKARSQDWRDENPIRKAEYDKKWIAANPERKATSRALWAANNKDRRAEANRKWRLKRKVAGE